MYTLVNSTATIQVPYVMKVDRTAEDFFIKTEKEVFSTFNQAREACLHKLREERDYLNERINTLEKATGETCDVFKL